MDVVLKIIGGGGLSIRFWKKKSDGRVRKKKKKKKMRDMVNADKPPHARIPGAILKCVSYMELFFSGENKRRVI